MTAPLVHIDGREVKRPLRLAADVIVVGSGPAGATVAARLAAGGLRVLVLEEGHAHLLLDHLLGPLEGELEHIAKERDDLLHAGDGDGDMVDPLNHIG